MKLYQLNKSVSVTEGAKVSQDLIQKSMNDPDMTFGFEVEFYIQGVNQYIEDELTKNAHGEDVFGPTKLLKDITWNDVIVSFEPVDYRRGEDIIDTMIARLEHVYSKRTGEEPSISNSTMFEVLKQNLKPYHIITMMKIYPKFGFTNLQDDAEDKAKKVVGSGNIIKATTSLKGLDNQPYVMYDRDLSIKPRDDSSIREAVFEEIAKTLKNVVGGSVVVNLDGKEKGETPKYSVWNLVGDVTLEAEYEQEDVIGMELVSPVMSPNEGMDAMKKVFSFIKNPRNYVDADIYGFTDEHTGLHINVGTKNGYIDPTKLVFLLGDQYVLKVFGREASTYAHSLEKGMEHGFSDEETGLEFKGIKDRRDVLMALGKELMSGKNMTNDQLEEILAIVSSVIPKSKYTATNLTKLLDGFVEFRALGGEGYHKRWDEINQMVHRFVAMLYVASEPEIYRREYLRKVYKFITNSLGYLDEPQGNDNDGQPISNVS